MRNRSIFFAAVCALPPAHGAPAPALPPRLLAAEKHGQLIFLLPETHVGLRWQFDPYFERVIEPAYAAASVLLSERSEEVQLDQGLRYQACADDDTVERQVDLAVNDALPKILPKTIWGRVPPPAPVTGFGRFMRTELLIDDIYFHKYADAATTAPERRPHDLPADVTEGYAAHLMLGAPRPHVSVDTPNSLYRAYCSLPPSARNDLAASLLRMRDDDAGAGVAASPATLGASLAAMGKAYRAMLAQNAHTLDGDAVAPALTPTELGVERFVLAARNRGWIERLPALTAGQRLPFFVLGAAHFPDSNAGPGVIHLLREAGYRLTLVRDGGQLRGLLAQLPSPPPPVPTAAQTGWQRAAWPGTCTPVPHNLLCAWGDQRAMLTAIGDGGGRDLLTLCTARATAWGKRSNCTSVRVPAGTVVKQGGG
nr:TraB/GumN family protein [uncultured Duganella sp.]